MSGLDIPSLRLHSQHISASAFKHPEQVVAWLGAVQAQDYAAAKWAVAQRARGVTDAAMDRALANGSILRTHVLRPTWHFVTPADIRWMLALTAPRVNAANTSAHRLLELDAAVFKRSNAALARALEGGRQLSRYELAEVLARAGIPAAGLRFIHLVMRAELDGVICSGPRRGKQFTYALLDERAPQAKPLRRDEAVARLASRYFASHGPATLQDFAWWSGLTLTDARRGGEMRGSGVKHQELEGRSCWSGSSRPRLGGLSASVHLLPNYDEYVVGYTDRSAIFDAAHAGKLGARENVLFTHTLLIDGRIRGTWKRTLRRDAVLLELMPFTPLTRLESRGVRVAAERFGEFLGLPAVVV